MKTFLIYSFSILALLLSGCNKDKIPGVYRIDIQQGNAVTQEMLNKLKPGMTKSQVAYVLGTPLIIDTFHPNRWDYLYSFHPGNGQREQRKLTLFFTEEETLSYIEGDTRTVAREDLPQEDRSDTNVVVPLNEKKTGLFQGLLNSVGIGEEEPETVKDSSADNNNVSPTPDKTESSDAEK
jgi:outer membrane protein assembly factor BamE